MSEKNLERINQYLQFLYGKTATAVFESLKTQLLEFKQTTKRQFIKKDVYFNQQEVILITYGDLLTTAGENPLHTLFQFYQKHFKDIIPTIHILPFYPYSSDDGFSVIDYRTVDPKLGDWSDILRFQKHGVRTMFDAVINHISAESLWFKGFLQNDPQYREYFISLDPLTDLSQVTRPRESPLLTPFETMAGTKYVWTTFSTDQIDLNYKNPQTLLDVIQVLLDYINHGADLIRLDAIAYLWKEAGTSSIHLPQTHTVVKLLRAIVDYAAPGVLLITETNVPHEENISYFGDGSNEAHMVYQFSLPPLTAHALITGSAKYLTNWAKALKPPSLYTTYFNFTASHDGIGVRPTTGILPPEELDYLLYNTIKHGGKISSKKNSDGSSSPYELNITYFDLLNDPQDADLDTQIKRFLVSQAIMLAMAGIPGVYIHNLLGSRNYREGVLKTGHARTINREKLNANQVEQALKDPNSLRHAVFNGYAHLLKHRTQEKAFHPNGEQKIINLNNAVFAILRTSTDGKENILALHNVSQEAVRISINPEQLGFNQKWILKDILSENSYQADGEFLYTLPGYGISWLKIENQ